MKKPSFPYVEVEWDDAHSPPGNATYNADDFPRLVKPIRILTRGWLCLDDPTYGVIIAAEYCDDDDYRSATVIPRQLIVRCEPYPPKRKRKVVTCVPSSSPLSAQPSSPPPPSATGPSKKSDSPQHD